MTQYARPDTDAGDGVWLNNAGNNTNLYSYVDDTSVNDSDYIESIDSSASADTVILDLSSVTDPENAANHTVFYRAKMAEGMMGGGPDLTVALFQGDAGSPIATKTDTGLTTSFSDDNLNLSTSEANAITDYGDLRIKFTRAAGGGAGGETATVSWCFFSCDAASSSIAPLAMNHFRKMRSN